jgi:hypothetical protein
MITYEKEAFKNLLDDFAEKVKEKCYDKLDYDLWRRLYTVARENKKVEIEHKTKSSVIQISWWMKHSNNEYKKHWVNLESSDGSLGGFLADELYGSNLQPKVDEYGTITFDTCYFGESTANKSILSYDSLDLDNVRAKCNNELRLDISPSGIGIAYGNSEPDPLATMSDLSITRVRVEELGKMVQDHINKDKIFNERKENNEMKGFNFDFGSCEGSNVRMSMYGMAVKNGSGTWVAYDKENEQIMDVDILNFEGAKYMYKLPVALKDIARGDVVIHNRRPMFVTGVANGKITAIDPFDGEEKVILLTRSPFGFDFATKVVCLFDGVFGKADVANPFGNMLPFLMMSGDSDIDPMMLMAMSGNMDMSNPMMMYFLMKDGGNSDLLPLMLMGGFGHTCGGNCHCGKED